ncbi:MAG: NifB/NifX family molybdenum-iron cluster-binding protein, partial [Synergistales bacterium]|nr:NifB/NifX family molybdenum-iron cluster-binding protein [Synergistales bacterium]
MKIAVATENGNVCPHFGHAPTFRIFETDGKSIIGHQDHPNPGHAPGVLPRWLSEMKVEVIIAGGMGPRAEDLFQAAGVRPVIGATGEAGEAAKAVLEGTLGCG